MASLVVLSLLLICYFIIGFTVGKPIADSDTTSKANLCPTGEPLTEAGSVVKCGCEPWKNCPDTHYCKLDKQDIPGFCCLKTGKNEKLINNVAMYVRI